MNSSTATLISILGQRLKTLLAEGNTAEAMHAANAAVEKAEQSLTDDPKSIDAFCSSLEMRAEILRAQGNHEAAIEDYRQAIDQYDRRPDRIKQVGRLHAEIGASYDSLGDPARATAHWETAMDAFQRTDPPSLRDVAALANNLGFLAKAAKDVEAAEGHFLTALEILHTHYGPKHEETAAVCNNLGALYHAARYYDQAREMHMMALDARRELFGDEHPDTAQSHNNLALALLETGDRSWARRYFEKALTGFEALGAEFCDDLEAVASNYCGFLREEGEKSIADLVEGRVREHLAKHRK